MRPWDDWRQEPYVEHRSLEECKHRVTCEEAQDDKAFRKMSRFEPGERVMTGLCQQERRENVVNTRRSWRVRNMSGGEHDWDTVTQGIDRPTWQGEPLKLREMPSVMNHTVRLASHKWLRAEFYGVKSTRPAKVVDEAELSRVLAEIAHQP